PRRDFQAIISNPPYIAVNDPHLEDLKFEPPTALVSGRDGLESISSIIKQAKDYLNLGGWLLLEHGFNQADEVGSLMQASGYENTRSYADLSGVMRMTAGQKTI